MNAEIHALQAAMERRGYIAEADIATAAFLAASLASRCWSRRSGRRQDRAREVIARVRQTELIRLQCYEGLDANTALYEWNYQRQILRAAHRRTRVHDPQALET